MFQKRRLRHIVDFIKSCAPSESLNQVLERVEQIEEAEPLEIYGEIVEENVAMDEQVELSKARKNKKKDGEGPSKRLKKMASRKK